MARKRKRETASSPDQTFLSFSANTESDELLQDPSVPEQATSTLDQVNRHLAQHGGEDQSDQALETLGKHGDVSGRVPNEVILASAGTGKTFQLSNRYLKLLALDQDPRRILATTFTRKAAGEILERIIHRLTAAALSDSAAEELSGFIGLSVNRDDCRVLLKRMIRFLNGLQIGTLDSFFGQVARTFCFELELPQTWQIVNEQDETRMQSRAIGLTLNDAGVLDLLHLLEKGEAARGIASQMRETVAQVYPLYNQTELSAWKIPGAREKLPDPSVDGLKSCLPAILETYGEKGAKTWQALIDTVESKRWDQVLKNTFARNVRDGSCSYSRKAIPEVAVTHVQQLLKYADELFVSQLQDRNTSAYQLMEHFDRHYRNMKSITGDLRFDNVQSRLARWVRGMDDPVRRMVARLDFHIEHLLLDEFQDTVPQQWRILFPIARSIAQPESQENPTAMANGTLFCVGDQKQAIYRWRGGDSRIFGTVQDSFESVQRRSMNVSFRSSPVVLNAVNEVFQNLHRHPQADSWMGLVEQWQEMFQEHKASPNNESLSGYVTLEQNDDEEGDLFAFAARRIAQVYEETEGVSIGVLVPRNRDVAIILGHLNRLNVPASEESGNPLSDSAAIQLLISLLQLLDHPGDSASWFHFLQSPLAEPLLAGFTKEEKEEARRAFPIGTQPIWERLRHWAQTTTEELLLEGLGDTISRWSQMLAGSVSARDIKRLKQATAAAYQYDSPAPLRTSELGRYLQQLKQLDRTRARVRVINIHQSKGLEFDVVVLTGIQQTLSTNIQTGLVSYQPDLTADPSIVSRYTSHEHWDLLPPEHQIMFRTHRREHMNEKMCQLYVAMTRARRALHMMIDRIKDEPPQSLAGVLQASLTDVDGERESSLLFETGQHDWALVGTESTVSMSEPESADSPSANVSAQTQAPVAHSWSPLAPPLKIPTRGLPRVSPSSLEGGATFPLASLLSSRQRQSAFLKGEIIHGWFELIDWLDDGRPTEADLRQRAQRIDVDVEHWEQWIPEFYEMLERPQVQEVMSRGYYQSRFGKARDELQLRVQNERPFAIQDAGQILNGFIDRLVMVSVADQLVGADIVDFKTDRWDEFTEEALADRVAHYRPQLEAYRIAVAKLTKLPLEQISARLVFVSIDRVEKIS